MDAAAAAVAESFVHATHFNVATSLSITIQFPISHPFGSIN